MSYEVYKAFSVVQQEIDQKVKQIQESLAGAAAKSFEEHHGKIGRAHV